MEVMIRNDDLSKISSFDSGRGQNGGGRVSLSRFRTDLIRVGVSLHNEMASNICQRLLAEVWRSYADDLDKAPQVEGIYTIGFLLPYGSVRYIYVGHSSNIHRRLQNHKRKDGLMLNEFVKQQFRLNNGKDLRIKWVEESNGECVRGEYRDCIYTDLGYWPDFKKKLATRRN